MNQFFIHDYFKDQVEETARIGRITRTAQDIYTVRTETDSYTATVSGKFRYDAEVSQVWPAIGDWVVYEPFDQDKARIDRVLNRRTVLSRKAAGTGNDEQIIAANVDAVFIVTSLVKEFNVQRIERYVMQVYESGATPAIVCTKRDLCDDVKNKITQIERHAPGVPVYTVNSLDGSGIDRLEQELIAGETISLIGSSGVGKSTLINRLLGEAIQQTEQVREEDGRGRHTTTHRELFSLSNGTVVIDTPGMRELQLFGESANVDAAFSDIEQLSLQCRFRDCSHDKEPGCAVTKAIEVDELPFARLKNYNKMLREVERLNLKDKYGTHRTNRILHGSNAKKGQM
ncbi:ribosome small subunit-dependent GTPase A [Halobacillus shinanisalinarum]|uniref:Small ribosomal subunit biogenesis GTPase RsgA n=1 Tax=Halobacillus shinanisalinarum TaxID=2932258 RepID=A0ABY4GY22_9BACI|nr:ribosome small subunit-dependent GTPase A [Halobacillus shinanisalinarum]UOQ92964.1 ribosome small subunit-dependent GTPase A [Halobacillus shinanisalinarum]